MDFNLEETKHIAKLSRLSLSSEEEKKYGAQIASILSYVKVLDELEIEKLLKELNLDNKNSGNLIGSKTELENVWRNDEVKEWDEEELTLALRQAELKDNYIKVKKVL